MSLKTRRLLYILFIIAFFTITPVIMLYAAGYTLKGGFMVQKTGMLIVDTSPDGAEISLNGKVQQDFIKKMFLIEDSAYLSPVKLKNLAPGDFDVTLKKEGYWDWQKKLSIKPGESTYIEDVILFKKEIPAVLISGKGENFSISSNHSFLASANSDSLRIADLENGKMTALPLATSSFLTADNHPLWSPDNSMLIYDFTVFSRKNGMEIDLKKVIAPTIQKTVWADNGSLYYLNGDKLFLFNLKNQNSEDIYSEKLTENFLIRDNVLYFIEENSDGTNVVAWQMKEKIVLQKISIPPSDYEISASPGGYLNIYDKTHHLLHVVNPLSPYQSVKESISNVSMYKWVDSEKLLYANENEIWLFDMNNRKNTLLTRISQTLQDIIWHPDNNYVIFSTAQSIFTLELDNREKFSITRLLDLEIIKNLEINSKGNEVYFYSRIGNQEGIYKLSIQ